MYRLTKFKEECTLSKDFPKAGIFLSDELISIFKNSTKENLQLLNGNLILHQIITTLDSLKMEDIIKEALKKAQKDSIYQSVFFESDGKPIISNIYNHFKGYGVFPPSLAEIFCRISSEIELNKNSNFRKFKGYELAGAIAYCYMRKAFQITHKGYLTNITNKKLNSLKKHIKENIITATELCLEASEAILLAKELLFEDKQKNIVATAKYLIEKSKKEAIKSNAIKASNARHKEDREIKSKILSEYDIYANKMILERSLAKMISPEEWQKNTKPSIQLSETTGSKDITLNFSLVFYK